jgi:hypothetical protein
MEVSVNYMPEPRATYDEELKRNVPNALYTNPGDENY